jgi:CubicO group peptidase (beta-lactamase class C family)
MKTQKSGMSAKRLAYVADYLQRIVDEGKVAGSGGLIIRHGEEAFFGSAGFMDMANKLPMKNDTLYRIYSMSKTFTVVAAMTFYEKGLFRLSQPISDFIPAFKDAQVAESDGRGVIRIVPARRPITFEHLFTMTSGLPYPGEESYSARARLEMQKKADRAAAQGKPWTTLKMAEEAAKLPLSFHPGEEWMYGFSHDILGALIEVLSGKTLGAYLKEVIFDPLGLEETAFFVPGAKRPRLAKGYILTPKGLREVTDADLSPVPASVPAYESGGGGLVSTMADVGKYAQSLLHNGMTPSGERILSRKTLELIRCNHVDVATLSPSFFPHMAGYGYGLGVRTMMDTAKAGLSGSAGEWAWDGMMGTWYCVDPAEDMTAVFGIQLVSNINSDIQRGFVQTVYSAIDD